MVLFLTGENIVSHTLLLPDYYLGVGDTADNTDCAW